MASSSTSQSIPRPAFVNPFERQRSAEKVPTVHTICTVCHPHLVQGNQSHQGNIPTQATSSPPNDGPGSATWRNRATSIFQSFSSNSSTASNSNYTVVGGGAIQLRSDIKTDLARDRAPSVVAQRKPSYVPKYAARAHMASMAGRSMMMNSDLEAEDQLRRGSRIASVAFPPGQRPSVAFPTGHKMDMPISVGGIAEE